MKLSDLDKKLAEYYLPQIMEPIKYGENAVFFWFPGAGMTTILRDMFEDKILLRKSLGKLSSQVRIIQFWGHLADKKDSDSLLNEAGFANYSELKSSCTKLLNEGNELVYVVSRIDEYSDKEKLSILRLFLKLNSLNPRRVHIIFNSMNRPWFIKTLNQNAELMVLANRMEIVPVLKGALLDKYIKQRSDEYEYVVSSDEIKKISETYGGVLQITKEFLRSKGDLKTLELKLRVIWNALPKTYRQALKKQISGDSSKDTEEAISDLEKFGVLNLKLLSNHKKILDINPNEILRKIFTKEELNLWNYCRSHSGEFISKDTVINILRPENSNETSFWAIDKAISRFRKKLAKSGVDPEIFKTLKGKGYIWNH
jgi:hypothetical protein